MNDTNCNIPWAGAIPSDWKIKRAKSMFTRRNEKGNDVSLELLSPSQKYGVIPQSLYKEITGAKPVQVSEATDLSTFRTVHKGDFCISLSAYMGGFEYSDYEGVISPAYVSFYKTDDLVDDYYKILFKSTAFIGEINRITPQSVRVGRNTPYDKFADVLLPVPSKEQQKRIASFLLDKGTQIDSLIKTVQTQIENLKAYKQSVITEVVTKGLDPSVPMKDSGVGLFGSIPATWSMKKFKHISDAIGDGIHSTPNYDQDGDVFFINGNNIGAEMLVFKDDTNRINEQEFQSYKQPLLTANTIFITLNGATYGKTSFYHGEKVLLGKSAGYITLKEDENKEYVRFYLQSHVAKLIMELSLLGTTIPNLSLRTLNEFWIPYPPQIEQQRIVSFLSEKIGQIDQLIAIKQQKIDKLNDYKKSLIYEYVTGKKEVS